MNSQTFRTQDDYPTTGCRAAARPLALRRTLTSQLASCVLASCVLQGRPEQNAQVGQCAPRAHDDRVHGRRSHREALQRSAQAQVPSLEACGAPRQASDKHLVSVRQACGSWPALRMAAVVRRQRRHAAWAGGPRSGFRCEGGARNLKNAKRYDVVCPDAARPPKPASGPRPQNDFQLVSKGGVQNGLQPADVIRSPIVCCILTY